MGMRIVGASIEKIKFTLFLCEIRVIIAHRNIETRLTMTIHIISVFLAYRSSVHFRIPHCIITRFIRNRITCFHIFGIIIIDRQTVFHKECIHQRLRNA